MAFKGSSQKHSSALGAKQAQRLEVAHGLPSTARVLEMFAGEGGLYRGVWARFTGICVDKVAAKVAQAARQRPRWGCYEGDAVRFLACGMAPEPWDVVDLDAYGEPWPALRAWATSTRAFAPVTHLFCTDGYRRQRNLSAPSRTLFPRLGDDSAVRKQARRAVVRAERDGKLPLVGSQPCAVCTRPAENWHHHDYAVDAWLDVTALCWDCHGKVHARKIPDPRLGRLWAERPRLILSEDAYDETVRVRLGEWGAPVGLRFEEQRAAVRGMMRYSYWRVTYSPAANKSGEADLSSLLGAAP